MSTVLIVLVVDRSILFLAGCGERITPCDCSGSWTLPNFSAPLTINHVLYGNNSPIRTRLSTSFLDPPLHPSPYASSTWLSGSFTSRCSSTFVSTLGFFLLANPAHITTSKPVATSCTACSWPIAWLQALACIEKGSSLFLSFAEEILFVEDCSIWHSKIPQVPVIHDWPKPSRNKLHRCIGPRNA